MKVFFERRDELVPGIWQFFFRPERPVDYVAGQYLTLNLPGVVNDPRGAGRVLTLTSLPTDELISFVVKYVEPHSPHKAALFALEADDPADITDAMGDLVLPKDPSTPLVFIAGGIGIASFVGMLQDLLSRKEERAVYLFYALRSRHEQIFRELTSAYPLQLMQTVFAPNHLQAQEVKDSTPPEALVYLSGSERFVEGLRRELLTLGSSHEQVVFDYFDGYTDL